MLYLQLPAEAAVPGPASPLPINEAAAVALERALLAADDSSRLREVSAAFVADQNVENWALRMAEIRARRTVNRADEAAIWLSAHLASELAVAITCDSAGSIGSETGWRLTRLAEKLAAVANLQADFERRLEHEKLESLKELAYGASHEINNPLANIAARAQTLLEDEADSERQRKLTAIHRQAMRAHEMIADLMLFARPPKLNRTVCELNSIVQKVVDEYQEAAREHRVRLIVDFGEKAIPVSVDATQISVAVAALVRNALEAGGDGGQVQVTTRRTPGDHGDRAEISVADDGPGISDSVRQHLFDPFFSGREAGRGLGFGLSKCWRIVTDHGGDVVVARRVGGAEFVIGVPMEVAPT